MDEFIASLNLTETSNANAKLKSFTAGDKDSQLQCDCDGCDGCDGGDTDA